MEPSAWGPSGWTMLHSMALEADRIDDSTFPDFVDSYIKHLPCEACKSHAQKYLLQWPVERPYFDWTVQFHNAVNIRLGKPEMDPNGARDMWNSKKCTLQCAESVIDVPPESKNSSKSTRDMVVQHMWTPAIVCLFAGILIYWFLIQWIQA